MITSLIDMGGPRTGTALSATGRQFLGDKMTVQTAQELTDLGLLPEGGWRKAGGTGITMNPGVDIKGVDQIKSGDIAGWFINTVAPAIEAKFGSGMSTADLIQESSKMFGQQTGQRLALMFLANEAQRQRDVAIKNGVDPSGVYQGMVDKDFGANVGNLGSAIVGFAQIWRREHPVRDHGIATDNQHGSRFDKCPPRFRQRRRSPTIPLRISTRRRGPRYGTQSKNSTTRSMARRSAAVRRLRHRVHVQREGRRLRRQRTRRLEHRKGDTSALRLAGSSAGADGGAATCLRMRTIFSRSTTPTK